jgi:hypothetical protein
MVSASDSDTEETEPFLEEEACLLTLEKLEEDLKTSDSVRFQINALLEDFHANFSCNLLLLPVLCIGTGLNSKRLGKVHNRPTRLCSIDFSIDQDSRITPHLLANGFEISKLSHLLTDKSFGVVFFAHVGTEGLPINDEMKNSLAVYSELIQPEGFLVYNSMVFANEDFFNQGLQVDDLNSFSSLEEKWRNLLSTQGFIDIQIAKKDEAHYFGAGTVSLVILGKKSLNYAFQKP